MDELFIFRKRFRQVLALVIFVGLIGSLGSIFLSDSGSSRIWANILLNNQYFLGIALGASFFLAVHRIAWSGWHTLLQRIPESIATYIPVAFVFMLIIYFGMHEIYHWSHYEGHDAILEGKKAWLNVPFFFVRLVFYFAGWIFLTWMMRKNSDLLMSSADLKFHNRRKLFAGLFLVFFAITVSTSSWDWIMSIDSHWYSTIFGWYVFTGMFVTSLAFIILIIWFLKRYGYLSYIRADHVHDLSTLLFAFSIFWTYLWFSQYLLIWYSHIPEETTYFIQRKENFRIVFFVNLGLNFLIPFFGLMRLKSKRQLGMAAIIALIVLIGHWIDYYQMIMPGIVGEKARIGLMEISITLFYVGIFIFVVFQSLASRPLIIKNDPFLQESLNYES
jgi:hypothetical protein